MGKRFKVADVILVQEHGELLHRNSEIRLVELIRYVPAKWTELVSFLDQRMEEAEAKQHPLPSSLDSPTQAKWSLTKAGFINMN